MIDFQSQMALIKDYLEFQTDTFTSIYYFH